MCGTGVHGVGIAFAFYLTVFDILGFGIKCLAEIQPQMLIAIHIVAPNAVAAMKSSANVMKPIVFRVMKDAGWLGSR